MPAFDVLDQELVDVEIRCYGGRNVVFPHVARTHPIHARLVVEIRPGCAIVRPLQRPHRRGILLRRINPHCVAIHSFLRAIRKLELYPLVRPGIRVPKPGSNNAIRRSAVVINRVTLRHQGRVDPAQVPVEHIIFFVRTFHLRSGYCPVSVGGGRDQIEPGWCRGSASVAARSGNGRLGRDCGSAMDEDDIGQEQEGQWRQKILHGRFVRCLADETTEGEDGARRADRLGLLATRVIDAILFP